MDMQSLPVSPAAAFGEALLLHDNLESDVDWDKAAFGIPIKLTGAMMLFFCLSGEVHLEDNHQEVVLTRGDVIIKVSGSMGSVRNMSPDIRFALIIMDKSFYFPILGSSRLASVQERLQVQPICHLEAKSLQECMDIYARMRFSMGLKHEMPLRRGFLQCSFPVLVTGRPLTLVEEDATMDAILNVWAPGTEGGHAVADVLFGDVNPSAKLTTTFPRSLGQVPLYYNHKNTGRPHGDYEPFNKFVTGYLDEINGPLYPFGFGLSYTTYAYSPVTLSASEMPVNGSVTASVTVTNTGDRDGDEIVQLYIHDIYATSTRPVKELKGFKKVHIAAGQSAQVDFTITADELSYYNHDLKWVCDPGDFEIFVSPDSRQGDPVRLTVR